MTFTRLRLGEPRLKGKASGGTVAVGGCEETPTYGANVLTDGGIETISEVPWMSHSAELTTTNRIYLPSDCSGVRDGEGAYPIVQSGSCDVGHTSTVVSTANPRTGSSHLRHTYLRATELLNSKTWTLRRSAYCDPVDSSQATTICFARAGDTVDLSAWLMTDTQQVEGANTFPSMDLAILFWDENLGLVSSATLVNDQVMATSYAEISGSIVAPASTWAFTAAISMSFGATPGGTTFVVDGDDFVVGVTH